MKNNLIIPLLFLNSMLEDDYFDRDILDGDYLFDNEVMGCLMQMYYLMMMDENDPKYEQTTIEFNNLFNKLDDNKKKYIIKEYEAIIEAQKNLLEKEEKKEKVKRKEK